MSIILRNETRGGRRLFPRTEVGRTCLIKHVCALLLSAVSVWAQSNPPAQLQAAPDLKVFGLQLGSDLSLPECRKTSLDGTHDFHYEIVNRLWCYQRTDPNAQTQILNEYIHIEVPFGDRTPVFPANEIIGYVLNGKLEGMTFRTLGVTSETDVLAKLRAKFGKPTTLATDEVQNLVGAKFESIYATWQFSNLIVELQGTAGRVDQGSVSIRTPLGKAAYEKAKTRLLNGGRPL